MDVLDHPLAGVIPIVPTPFTASGDLDLSSLESVVGYLLDTGVHGLAVLGMASEGPALTDAERDTVIRTAADRIGSRVPLIAGCNHHSGHAAAQLALASAKAGADCLMVMPPFLGRPEPDDIATYYAEIDASTQVPVIVQDNPGWTGIALPASLYEYLATLESIRYVKVETRHSPTTMRSLVRGVGDRFTLLGGLAGTWLPEELARGIAGTMPGSIMPQVYLRVWDLWSRGARDLARATFDRYHPVIRVGGQPGIGIPMTKDLLSSIGVIATSRVRSPLHALDPNDREDIDAVVSALDLLAIMRGDTPPTVPG